MIMTKIEIETKIMNIISKKLGMMFPRARPPPIMAARSLLILNSNQKLRRFEFEDSIEFIKILIDYLIEVT